MLPRPSRRAHLAQVRRGPRLPHTHLSSGASGSAVRAPPAAPRSRAPRPAHLPEPGPGGSGEGVAERGRTPCPFFPPAQHYRHQPKFKREKGKKKKGKKRRIAALRRRPRPRARGSAPLPGSEAWRRRGGGGVRARGAGARRSPPRRRRLPASPPQLRGPDRGGTCVPRRLPSAPGRQRAKG